MSFASRLTRLQARALLTGVALAAALTTTVGVQAQTPAQPAASAQAQAQSGGRGNWGDPAARQQRMAERHAQRMADLKAKLAITPAQESAWNTWTAAKPPFMDKQGPRMNRDQWQNLTTPERLDRMLAMQQERATQMRAHADATKIFYNVLTAEQKKVFDDQTMRMMGPRGGKGGPRF